MQNMFTQKILLAGVALVVVIGGVVAVNSRSNSEVPTASLDTVTERAKDLMEGEASTSVATEVTTTSSTVVATPEPEATKVEPTSTTPEPVKPVATTPAPVVTTPAPVAPAPTGITKAEVSAHASADSCWSVIGGSVYDLTSYITRHPGGKSAILGICGKDGTRRMFESQHGGQSKPERVLSGLYLDNLAS